MYLVILPTCANNGQNWVKMINDASYERIEFVKVKVPRSVSNGGFTYLRTFTEISEKFKEIYSFKDVLKETRKNFKET